MSDEPSHLLLGAIARARPGYSPAFRKLADFVLNNALAVSTMNIDELARAAGVSVATINRFAHRCGCDGYPPFRATLRKLYESAYAPVEKLRLGLARDIGAAGVVRESLDSAAGNIRRSHELLQDEQVRRAVELLANASQVYVAGLGVSAIHAAFAANCLEPFRAGVKDLAAMGGVESALRRINVLRAGDLVIGIALPRYSRGIVELLGLARQRDCKVLALTDGPASPIAALADTALYAVAEHPLLYASNAGMVALIEALGAALAQHTGDSLETISAQTERLLPYLYLDQPP